MLDRAAVGPHKSENNTHEGRFTPSVRPRYGNEVAAVYSEVHI